MRSSRHKLKLLRTISGRTNGGTRTGSPPIRTHTHQIQQPASGSPRPNPIPQSRTLKNNNNNNNNNNRTARSLTVQQYRSHNSSASGSEDNLIEDENLCENFIVLPMMEVGGHCGDIKKKAFAICRDYLHGAWKQIDLRDLVLKRVSGGLSNYLYHCSLPGNFQPIANEPSQVLLRFYGQVHGEDALESVITESVIFALLSERKLGPKLYGVFPGGRLEQFIPARPLQTHELRDPELSTLISQKMAQIHALNIPISKEASWLWGTMDKWMAKIRDNFSNSCGQDDKHAESIQIIHKYNLCEELKWLRNYLTNIDSPVVFSHNDLQEGNILVRPEYNSQDEKLVLIDFEYCSYNYRGFDLANHFCEWSYNYNVESYPNFAYQPGDLPSEAEKLRFICHYVKVLKQEYQRRCNIDNNPILFDVDHIIKEVDAFVLASHFFWSLWAIVNAQISKIPFGYWEYGLSRLETYHRIKKNLG